MKRSLIGRRSALATPLALAAIGALAFGTASAAPSATSVTDGPTVATSTTALPSVDMARVLAAAQVEPRCGDRSGLSDNASTKLVQSALNAKGISTTADGWYGNGTTGAYATWQRRLGYSGIDANGLPGVTSLTNLGTNRFSVAHKVSTGSRTVYYGGKRVNQRTKTMLQAADNLLPNWNFTLTQGSYNPGGVSASAGTHDGGGVVDISVSGLSSTQRWQQREGAADGGLRGLAADSGTGFQLPHPRGRDRRPGHLAEGRRPHRA